MYRMYRSKEVFEGVSVTLKYDPKDRRQEVTGISPGTRYLSKVPISWLPWPAWVRYLK